MGWYATCIFLQLTLLCCCGGGPFVRSFLRLLFLCSVGFPLSAVLCSVAHARAAELCRALEQAWPVRLPIRVVGNGQRGWESRRCGKQDRQPRQNPHPGDRRQRVNKRLLLFLYRYSGVDRVETAFTSMQVLTCATPPPLTPNMCAWAEPCTATTPLNSSSCGHARVKALGVQVWACWE